MEKGTLIEFRVDEERRLAVAERPEGKKDWIVIDQKGQSFKIRPQKVEYTIGGGSYIPSDIPEFLNSVQSYLDPDSLEIAWEILIEDGAKTTPQQMAELLFSDQTPPACYAAHSLLSQDKIYFKRKGDSYEPRSESQVEQIKHQQEVEIQKNREKEEFLVHLKEALDGKKINWTESDRARLETISKIPLYPDQDYQSAKEILASIKQSADPQAVFNLLVQIGWWSEHENLFLRRSSYPVNFPQKVLDVTRSHLQFLSIEPESDRLDLTHLKVYTVDDESTTEIDDGLSIEYIEDGKKIRLWIHIADPTRLVIPGDELDLEARRRSTTLYLPTGMISMFPPELATGPMSLVQGQTCYALSFGVILDEVGAIEDYTITPTLIKPTYRLTYGDVDEMLELGLTNEREIAELAKAALLRQEWRKSQGSIQIRMPESSIKVKDEEITIELLEGSQSRQLVAEMMILAGEVTGKYGKEHNLPLPFRGQPQPELPPEEELLQLPAGPVRYCALRRCMPRSEMSLSPLRHASLGLDNYIQVTSPIRRYTDLLVHFQLKAHLRGDELPFPKEHLQEILYSVGSSAYEATLVERQTNRYWGLEYLRRNSDLVWQALVLRWLREDEDLGMILIEDLGLELPHRFERPVTLGDRIDLKVSRVDPHRDEIRFQEAISANL